MTRSSGARGAAVREALGEVLRVATTRRGTGVALALGVLLCLRTALLQLWSMALPVHFSEGHNWRETFTYGVAWNWAHGAVDVLHPRMFVFHAKSNVVPMEPPLYPLVSSLLLRLTGDSVVGPRLLSFGGLVVTVAVLWSWLGRAGRESSADDGGWEERAGLLLALALAPAVAVEFRQMQPEPTCAGLAIGAAWFASTYARTGRWKHAALAVGLAGLAVLVKPVALGVLPGIVAFGLWGPESRLAGGGWKAVLRRALVLGVGIVLVLVPYAAWDRWSHRLQATEMNGAFFIAIEHDPKVMFQNVATMKYAREALLFFLPSYAGATWLVPAFVAGVYRSLTTAPLRRLGLPMMVWLVFYLVELLAVGDRLHSNAYYFILAPAPVAFFSALGLGAMLRVLGAPRAASRSLPLVSAGLLVTVLLPVGTMLVRNWRWSNTTDIAALGLEKNRAMWGDDIGVARLLVATLVVFAFAPYLRPWLRRLPGAAGAVIVTTILGAGAWAVRDQAQYFRYYIAADKRDGYADEVAALRAEVDRHSRREDLVVATPGWSAQSPNMLLFFLALRNGFPITTEPALDPMNVAPFVARGAKLYLRVDLPGDTRPPVPGKLLAERAWWRLSCIGDCVAGN